MEKRPSLPEGKGLYWNKNRIYFATWVGTTKHVWSTQTDNVLLAEIFRVRKLIGFVSEELKALRAELKRLLELKNG